MQPFVIAIMRCFLVLVQLDSPADYMTYLSIVTSFVRIPER